MTYAWTATYRFGHSLPRHVGHEMESCPLASVRCSLEQLLFECVRRLNYSFYSVFPWMSLSFECLDEWFGGLTRRNCRDNRRGWGYERPPSHPYLRHYLDYECRTRCRFRLVSFFCFLLGSERSERPTRSRILAAFSMNSAAMYQIREFQSVTWNSTFRVTENCGKLSGTSLLHGNILKVIVLN